MPPVKLQQVMIKLPMMVGAQSNQVRWVIDDQIRCSFGIRSDINNMADLDMFVVTADNTKMRSFGKIYLTCLRTYIVPSIAGLFLAATQGGRATVRAIFAVSPDRIPTGSARPFRLSSFNIFPLIVNGSSARCGTEFFLESSGKFFKAKSTNHTGVSPLATDELKG